MAENEEAVMEAGDIAEALETIKSIEMMGFFMEDVECKLKYSKGIFHCMNILRDMHDQLVAKLPANVIEQERAKQGIQTKPPQKLSPETPAQGVA